MNDQTFLPLLDNISARLNAEENALRLALLNRILDAEGDAEGLSLRSADPADREAYAGLMEKKCLVPDARGNLQFLYPVSVPPTPHRVRLADGRSFYAMCAIDAMGAAFTFRQDVEIASRCSHCAQPVNLAVRGGEIEDLKPPATHVLHVDLNKFGDWSASC